MAEPRAVTAIRTQARTPDRVNVYLDDRFAFGLDRRVAEEAGLRTGDVLDPIQITHLRAHDDVSKATNAALHLLARRPRSIREVRSRLRDKGYEAETIDAAVAKLEGWRYVDDSDFARFWVENRITHKPRGRRMLEQELWQKGVDREVARQAIDESELDEYDAALTVATAKLSSYAGLDRAVAYRRLAALLARRGFGYDVVKRVLGEILDEADGVDENITP